MGGPTPENSAEIPRAVQTHHQSHSHGTDKTNECGDSDEEATPGLHATSPHKSGRQVQAMLPWMENPILGKRATGRRSFRQRRDSNTTTSWTASLPVAPAPAKPVATVKEDPPALMAPKPMVPVTASRWGGGVVGRGLASAEGRATPPLHLAGIDVSAAALLLGSPGAGMAAADTLLQMLMMGATGDGAVMEDGKREEKKKTNGTGMAKKKRTGVAAKTSNLSKSSLEPKSTQPPKKRKGESGSKDESMVGEMKKAKKQTNPSDASNPRAPPEAAAARAAARVASDEKGMKHEVGKESIVPDTAMYTAASAAAAKRRMLPSRGGGRQKVHRPWTLPEVEALVEGVSHYGRGQWADIKSLEANGVSAALASRSAVDLKDKWRNLLRIAMLPVLYKRREATEVPPALLAKVRELAAQKGSPRGGRNREGSVCAEEAGVAAGTSGTGPGAGTLGGAATVAGGAPKGARRSKHHSPWTLTESRALVEGVEECGGCRWTVIKKLGVASLERRTAMDLKDKWRNLLQLASLPSQSRRKAETPPELLQQVLRLEAKFGVARRKGRKSGSTTAVNVAAVDGDAAQGGDDAKGEEITDVVA